MKLAQVEWGTVARSTVREFRRDEVLVLAAAMAYHFIFALFPFAIFLAALTGFVGRFIGEDQLFQYILNYLETALPDTTVEAIRGPLEQVTNAQNGGALSLGVLLALVSASNGVVTVMQAFNRAYGIEETRNIVVKRLVALGLTLVLSLLLVSGFILLIFGGDIGAWLAGRFGFGGAFAAVWNVLRIPLVLVGISLGLAILYWKGPHVDQQFEWITPGSVLATLLWFLATVAFGFYVQSFAAESFRNTYGAVSGLILFLFYLYLTSVVILLGAELNAETTKRYDPELIRDKMTDPRKQLPGKQPRPDPQAAAEAGVTPRQVAASNWRSAAKLAGAGDGQPLGAEGRDPARDFADPTVGERLRTLRRRPAASAAEQARARQARLAPAERERRTQAALTAFAVSTLAALGGVLIGSRRRTAGR